jgi:hypothetical protein
MAPGAGTGTRKNRNEEGLGGLGAETGLALGKAILRLESSL